MGNDPLLYIDSIKNGDDFNSSNQEIYDSRIKTKKSIYEGVVLNYNDDSIKLKTINKDVIISIFDIENINILKL